MKPSSHNSKLDSKAIQGVLFDLDGTLRHNRPSSTHVFLDYAVQLGAADGAENRRRAIRWSHYYWAQSDEMLQDMESFSGQEKSFWINYACRQLETFGCLPDYINEHAPEISRYMWEEHRPEDWVPQDVPVTLNNLKEAGYRMAVLSNRREPCDDQLHDLGLRDYFDFTMVAGEINIWKPEPQIFHHALQKLGLPAEKTMYVGDNYYADIVGARAAGLQPVLIDPEGVFPDPGCPVIRQLSDLPPLLSNGQHSS